MMAHRRPVNKRKDKKHFTRTATKVKAVNLPDKIYRGGIRF